MRVDHLPKTPGLYSIAHYPTGQVYIGYSKNVRKRVTSHRSLCRAGRDSCTRLQRAWTGTLEKEWTAKLLCERSPDPAQQEVNEILAVPAELRLNTDVAHSGRGISNENARQVSSERMIEKNRQSSRAEYLGVDRHPSGGYRYRIQRLGRRVQVAGFSTALEAYLAREKALS